MKMKFLISLVVFAIGVLPVFATELTGQLNTGFGNNTIQGIVVSPTLTPTPIPSPTSGGGSGGGGGGGGGGGLSSITSTPTPTPTPLTQAAQQVDVNSDGKIDVLDFNSLIVNWGSTNSGNATDFNNDNKVDILDFNLLMVNWTG